MRPQTTLDQALVALAFLLNQSQAPTAERSRWQFFVTSAVERLYRSFDYDTSLRTVSLTANASGVIDLTTIADKLGIVPAIESIDNGLQNLTYVMAKDAIEYVQGDYKWWLTLDASGNYKMNVTDPSSTYTIRYYESPAITTLQAAAFTRMVIAKGALIYYRLAQDPEADTSIEEDAFKQEVAEVIELQNRRRPQQFATSHRDVYGRPMGSTD